MSGESLTAKEREDRDLRRLQYLVQLTLNLLSQQDMPLDEAVRHVEGVKRYALSQFPGKERAWDMIYAPRFYRVLRQRWGYVPNTPDDE